MTAECAADGSFQSHVVGSVSIIQDGNRFQSHGNTSNATVTCTAEIDGITFEIAGIINRSTVTTQP
jgi:hypothetical protein